MSLIDIKNQIKNNIEQVKALDITKLYPDNPNIQSWNNWGNDELKKYVNDTIGVLKVLSDNLDKIDSSGLNNAQNLNNHLDSLITEYNNQLSRLNADQVTNQHHAPLNQLEGINNILRSSGLYTDLVVEKLLDDKVNNLNKLDNIAKDIIPRTEDLNKAISTAEKWQKSRRDINKRIVDDRAKAFLDRAQDHKWKDNDSWIGNWIWLAGAFIFAIVIFYITESFIDVVSEATKLGKSIEIGEALLRIASLAVPTYLMVFCANQFLYHKKMYDNYMFKYASLNTMTNLISTHLDSMSDKILKKGLDVIFSEPKIKESGKYDSHLVNELIGMLKSQLNK